MFKMIYALEKRLNQGYEFLSNIAFYLGRGHRLRDAIRMARNTL